MGLIGLETMGYRQFSGTDPKHGRGTSITGRTKYLAHVPCCKRVCLSVDGLVLSVVGISRHEGVEGEIVGGWGWGWGERRRASRRHADLHAPPWRPPPLESRGWRVGGWTSIAPPHLSLSLALLLSSLFTSPLFHTSLSPSSAFPLVHRNIPHSLSLTPSLERTQPNNHTDP